MSATVPSLRSSGRIDATYFPVSSVSATYGRQYYGDYHHVYHRSYPHHRYGYCYSYPYSYGFGLSLGFSYPYWGIGIGFGTSWCGSYGYPSYYYSSYYDPYYCYPSYGYRYYCDYPWYGYPWRSSVVRIRYPYVGYYYAYPYPYLDDYGYYDCDFYRGGYYVRFGYYRTSYYYECSGLGSHAADGHHVHVWECPVHGRHYYHIRDCPLCNPSVGTPVYNDIAVPEVSPDDLGVEPASDASSEGSVPAGSLVSAEEAGTDGLEPKLEVIPLDRDEAFFASLKPAQLSFALGVIQFQHGQTDEAVESLFSASLEDPTSELVKLFLATALVPEGEYAFAAEYYRLALDDWTVFPSYSWDLRGLYPGQSDLDRDLALLEEDRRLNPGDVDVLLLLGLYQFHAGDREAAVDALSALSSLSDDPVDLRIADRYLAESRRQESGEGAGDADLARREWSDDALLAAWSPSSVAVERFLSAYPLSEVPYLPIR